MPNEVKLLPCEDKCAICGKLKMQHTMNCGVGMCQIYPTFVSERKMLERLSPTTLVTDEVVERVAYAIRDGTPSSATAPSIFVAMNQAREVLSRIASMPTVVTGEQRP